ncbi:bifunctional oligoribonuclease/PAP phosphatase NrnA [Christensenellaceae bacterium OttesenSCG-928-M15]|nr:bifunctional oligoribonuclease/PAP phosphatase NrnA [Christensenellaceae bacterium OttesenSCG-928-M15]
MTDAVREMAQWLRQNDEYTLISHVSPDGDTIGSALALYGILCGMGKRVRLCCDQPVPRIYGFLPWSDVYEQPAAFEPPLQNVVSIDCADPFRMGYSKALFDAARCTGNVDHHRTNDAYGAHIVHDEGAAATGELIFKIWHALEGEGLKDNPAAKEIAICLFTAICTDTGSFAYTNTTPETFQIAAALVALGVDTFEVNREVYRSVSMARTRLKGFILSQIELHCEGKVAIATVTIEDLKRFSTTSEDMEGMIDSLRDIDTVEIAMILREDRDDVYKISFRSKKYADVSAVANRFGGGGHLRAAGCAVKNNIEMQVLKERLIKAAAEAL